MSDLLNRRGTFEITRNLISSNPEGVIEALKDILIVHIDDNFIRNSIVYWGYSKHFDLVEESEMVPKYTAKVETIYDGNHEVKGIVVEWLREKEYSEQDVKSMLKEIQESFANSFKE